MHAIKIVHCADVHLDSCFSGTGLRNERAKLRAEELKDTFARVVRLVREESADVLLIAGDLLEHQYVRKPTVQYLIDLIAGEIPDVPVFIAPGNHDPLVPDSYYATMRWPENVTIFGPEWKAVPVPGRNAVVHGWGFDRAHVSERRLAELQLPPSDLVQIVVVHGSDEHFPSDEGTYLPLNRAECVATGADYIALGHFHGYGVVADKNGTPLAVYPGAPESLTFGQLGEHGVIVGTVTKAGTQLRLVPVTKRRHLSVTIDCSGVATIESVVVRIEAAIPPGEREQHLYRMTLTGEVDPQLELDLSILHSKLAHQFYHVTFRDDTRSARDIQVLAAERSLKGEFVRRILAQIQGEPGREGELRLAMEAGIRSLEGGR